MTRVFFTEDGSADFRKAKVYARLKWGVATRNSENSAVKAIVAALAQNPQSGTVPTALADIGMHDFRQSLTSYNRVFHYYDHASDSVYIVMVIPQMRDFPTHLAKRILNAPTLRSMRP